jgi:phosphoribosylglycinamide formyltransferase-1
MKLVFICSKNGGVIQKYFQDFGLVSSIEIISDRHCGLIDYAIANQLPYRVYESQSGLELSDKLLDAFKGEKDILFISFYTRLLGGSFLKEHAGRLINFHPSILPSCPGQDGFGDTIRSGSNFVGSTVHLIDDGIDTGKPILQAAFPRDPDKSLKELRHRVFLQQVVSLAQVVSWYAEGKTEYNSNIMKIIDAKYDVSEFSPNLNNKIKHYFDKAI